MAIKNRFFPHMMPEEIPIWERYLADHESEYDTITYDVKVGTPVTVPDEIDAKVADGARLLSMKRIDAIGWKMGVPTIIEVKLIIGMKAIGQIITYPILYAKQAARREIPDVLIVGEQLGTDMKLVLDLMEIPFILV